MDRNRGPSTPGQINFVPDWFEEWREAPEHKEVMQVGDLYYMAPGYSMAVDAGAVLMGFSPKEEFLKLTENAKHLLQITGI